MKFIDDFRYKADYAKLSRIPLYIKKTLSRCNRFEKFNNFEEMLELFSQYEEIAVLGSGPSLSKLEISDSTIYITTNSSYLSLSGKADFIHILNDMTYIRKYLLFGLKYKAKKIYFYLPFKNKTNYAYQVMQIIERNKTKYLRNVEVVSQSENLNFQKSENIYDKLEDLNNSFEVTNRGGNSGLMILQFGLLMAHYFKKPISVYGLDAGEGGKIYFDGTKTPKRHVAMRENNKKEMGEFLEYISKTFPLFKNYSYFKGNA